MKLFSILGLCCLLSSTLLHAAPAAWRFTNQSVLAADGRPGWQISFDKYAFTEQGLRMTIGSKSEIIEYKNLNIDTNKYKYLDIFHCGQAWYPAVLVYEAGASGFGKERCLDFTLPGNDRVNPQRTTVDMTKLAKWQGTIQDVKIIVMESGIGSTAAIQGMVFRSHKDTLENGAFLLAGEKNIPLYWQQTSRNGKWSNRVDVNKKYALPVWEMQSAPGSKCTVSTKISDLQQDNRYQAAFKIKNAAAVQAAVVIYDDNNKVIAEHKLQPKTTDESNQFTLYSVEYTVKSTAYRGELQINLTAGRKRIELQDAMVVHLGGAETWRGWWIWAPGEPYSGQHCHFRKEFNIDDPDQIKTALLQATCDDAFTLEVNNNRIMNMNNWSSPQQADVKKYLLKGKNVITVSGYNSLGAAGMLAELKLIDKQSQTTFIASDSSWLYRTDAPEEDWRRVNPPTPKKPWQPSVQIAPSGSGAWGTYVKYYTELPAAPVWQEVDKSRYQNQQTNVKINTDLNYPRLEINNKILPPVIFGVSWRGDRSLSYNPSKGSGFKIIRLSWEFSFEDWYADGRINYKNLENAMEEMLRYHPDGWAIIDFRITAPPWWIKKYPDEVVQFSDGTTTGADGIFASCASEIWRKEINEKLFEAISTIEKSWYGSRIIGYMPCNLRGPEWVLDWKPNAFPDTSKAMHNYFRKQMRIKYKNDVEALRKAWNMPNVTFDTIEIPALEMRRTIGDYFLPGDRQIVFDYTNCIQTASTDNIMEVMDVIKKVAPNKLRAVYYGYLMTLAHLYRNPQLTSHYDLSRLLASGKIDLMASPVTYVWRRPGDISGCGSVEESYKQHNVLWLQEADNRTYLTGNDSHKVTFHAEASIKENRREFIYALGKRDAIWFYDLGGGWYANDYFHKEFRKMLAVYGDAIKKPLAYQTPVAAFFDEKAVLGITLDDGRWGQYRPYALNADWQRALAAAGLPFDTYELSDVYNIDLDKYKVFFFPNAWRSNPQLAEFVREKILAGKRMVVWVYAPGFGQTTQWLKSMQDLTNIKMAQAPAGTSIYYQSNGRGIGHIGCQPGNNIFCVNDRTAQPLAFYPDRKTVAAAIKKVNNGWSVYLPANDYSGITMRQLYKHMNLEMLLDTADRVVFDGEYLGVIATDKNGTRTVTLPANCQASEVQEVFSGKVFKVSNRQFTFPAETADALLFKIKK